MSDLAVRNIVATIGGPESTPGTAETREYVLPIRAMPGLGENPEKIEDPIITGNNMTKGEITVAKNVSGDLQLSPRCCGGFGQILNGALGQESAPTQIAACIRVRYTGSDASCDIAANTSSDQLTSDTGDKGSESGDAAWGTAGVIDLTDLSTDTVGELVTEIDGYSDYDCEKVFGSDSTDAGDIIDITTAQGKSRWVYIWFSSSDSGYYLHKWPVVLTNTLRPVYSIQLDKMHDDRLFDGCAVSKLDLSAAVKALVEATASIVGFVETTDAITPSDLDLEDVNPLIFSQGSLTIGEHEFTDTRKIALSIENALGTEGYGMGSLSRQSHRVPTVGVSGSMSIRYDSDIFGFRTNVFDDAVVGISLYFKANSDFATDIPQLLLIDIPYAQLKRLSEEDNAGIMDVALEILATNPDGAYSDPITVYMITDDSGAY
ncbi:MAG: phage tail tube protein [Chloroflexota bacterium]|nr:phage tail tube protein [Chloroflexota bacterium]